jgi:eukaryotic-like serine/threonine-protein kinase
VVDTPDDATAEALRRAVFGQFLLKEEIGRGGMGAVYRAYDEQLERDVAIKTLPPHMARDPQVRARFLREARTAASLSHPNIVPIYSAAERDGVVYFAMGLVTGKSLAQHIAEQRSLAARELIPILQELAGALGYAHSRGVVHRDVKAENVLMDATTGRAMVTDFGIARVAEAQPLTATGTVLGTVHYMSPEQVSGDRVDGRSDLYSLGVLAFFALTGRFPFERPSASAVVVAHVIAQPPRLREVLPSASVELEALIARLLAKSPTDRFADAVDLSTVLADPRLLDETLPAFDAAHHLTSTEAQEVWARAAELQANTGVVPPPVPFISRGDEPLVTVGYDAGLVRQSAIDAGIDAVHVERALSEKARVERTAMTVISPGDVMQKRPNWFLGARTTLEYAASLDGELDGEDFEEIAEEVRRALGELVSVSSVGRTLTINTSMTSGQRNRSARMLQLTLASRKGLTLIRAHEDLTGSAVGWFVGLGFGGGTGALALGTGLVAAATHSPPIAIASAVAIIAGIFSAARALFGRTARKRDAEIQELLKRVVEKARTLLTDRPQRDAGLRAPPPNRLLR